MTLVTPDPQRSLPQQSDTITPSAPQASRPGDTFVETAEACLDAYRWKHAVIALKSAKALRPDDPEIDQLLLEAASNDGQRRLARRTRAELGDRIDRLPDGLTANAASLLAEQKFAEADKTARAAIKIEPNHARAWTLLAASYAGLGWFDQARECLDGAARYGSPSSRDLWYVGRATNQWAMNRSRVLPTMFITTVLFNVFLAFSLGIAAPFVSRGTRVRKLPAEFRIFAEHQWDTNPLPRLVAAAASIAFLGLFIVSLVVLSRGGTP